MDQPTTIGDRRPENDSNLRSKFMTPGAAKSLTRSAWPNGDHRVEVPDTSMLPGSETAPPAAVGLLKDAAQGAHDSLDRLVDRATPAVRKLGDSVAAVGETLHAKTDQWRETGDEWIESLRTTVRSKPLLSVVAALALGALIARIPR